MKPLIILDPSRIVFFRRPRSKKRRIIRKWWKRKENWRPDNRCWEQKIIVGSGALNRAYGPPPTDEERERLLVNIDRPRILVHPDKWAEIVKADPGLLDKVEVQPSQK